MGIGTTRRFLLEWLSFAHRYVPVGLLEHLPPNIQDRPPRFKGRNDLETLMASEHYKDWIKLRYVFFGCLLTWRAVWLTCFAARCSWVLRTLTSSLSRSISPMRMRLKLRVREMAKRERWRCTGGV
jgi:hypothetical protein